MKTPPIAIIGGSGLYEIDSLQILARHKLETPFGPPSDTIIEGILEDRRVLFLPRHGLGHRLLAHEINHRANIWALRSLGTRHIISVTAVGSLKQEIAPRHLVIPDQLVDRTGKTDQHTFFGNGVAAHISFAEPYSAALRQILITAAASHTPNLHPTGTYTCMNGPAFSTRAEANMHRTLGFDIIGMTNSGEARLAREAQIALATLAFVTDYDCWKTDEPPVEIPTVIANLHANSELAKTIIRNAIPSIPSTPHWPEHQSLQNAILTPRHLWPPEKTHHLTPLFQ